MGWSDLPGHLPPSCIYMGAAIVEIEPKDITSNKELSRRTILLDAWNYLTVTWFAVQHIVVYSTAHCETHTVGRKYWFKYGSKPKQSKKVNL